MRSICHAVTREQPPALPCNLNGDWTSLGQHERHPEFPFVTRESCRNSRKITRFPRHRKTKPFPSTAFQEKSHVQFWSYKRYFTPWHHPKSSPTNQSHSRGYWYSPHCLHTHIRVSSFSFLCHNSFICYLQYLKAHKFMICHNQLGSWLEKETWTQIQYSTWRLFVRICFL